MKKRRPSVDRELLSFLWNNVDGDRLPEGGDPKHPDRFIGPRTFIREGVFNLDSERDSDEAYAGIEYRAVITLGRLVPKSRGK